jgi:hypothetical protein
MNKLNVSLTLEEFGMVLNYLVNNHNADENECKNVFINYWINNGKNKNAEVAEIDWNGVIKKVGIETVDNNTLLEIILECKVFIANYKETKE